MPDQDTVVFDPQDQTTKELMKRICAIMDNTKLRKTLLKKFSEPLVAQLIDATAMQYIGYVINQEKLNPGTPLSQISMDMVNRNADFFEKIAAFYDSTPEHPIDLKMMPDFGAENARDMELLKFIIFLFNQHGLSNMLYTRVGKNKEMQFALALDNIQAYVEEIKEGEYLPVLNVLTRQYIIIDMMEDLEKEIAKQ